MDAFNNDEDIRLQAWRICRAWKETLAIELDKDRVADHLRDMADHFAAPTLLADKVLADIEAEKKSKVVVLAELKKEPDGNRAQKGDANDTRDEGAVRDTVFED
jgi:hypothetical protein